MLKDVSFVIQPGESVAFVGATGAGKSSILNLIGRYYDIQKGQILIDDVDIRDLNYGSNSFSNRTGSAGCLYLYR